MPAPVLAQGITHRDTPVVVPAVLQPLLARLAAGKEPTERLFGPMPTDGGSVRLLWRSSPTILAITVNNGYVEPPPARGPVPRLRQISETVPRGSRTSAVGICLKTLRARLVRRLLRESR
jgi:hypothetical protein